MKPYLEILMNNWEILSPIVYEILARLWPTRWNISILDNAIKIINWIVPNLRKKKGNEMMANEKQNLVPVNLNKHIIKSLLILFLFVPLVKANAQIWQNFKGIRLVNESDTAQQLSVQGSLFYDDVVDSLYLYNGTRWLNLTRVAAGGGNLSGTLIPGRVPYASGVNSLSNTTATFSGTKVSFTGSATSAGLNVGSVAGNPSALVNGDIWYNSASNYFSGVFAGGARVFIHAVPADVVTANAVPFLAGTGRLISNSRFTYVSNFLTLLNTANTHTTTITGGEMQLDFSGGSGDITFNVDGIYASGLSVPYEISSTTGVELTGDITLSPVSSASQVYANTYTPTGTAVSNITGAVTPATDCHYSRVGNVVTVSGLITGLVPTAASSTLTVFRVSLPIASDFTNTVDCTGTFAGSEQDGTPATYYPGAIIADAANNEARFSFASLSTTDMTFSFSFQYVVK